MTCPLGAPAPAQSAGAYLLKQDEHNSAHPDATVRSAGNVLHRSIKGQVPRFFQVPDIAADGVEEYAVV